MLVRERMSQPVISVPEDMPVQEALAKMKNEKISRFPVVNKKGNLVGIVSEDDLLNASPSSATTLSVWEVNYLLSKITVERVMTKNVISINDDTPLEDAARIMADNRIGGMPVLHEGKMVGIITETDLFRVFLELLGARESGVRLTALVKEKPGTLHQLTKAIDEAGGNIIALSTFSGVSSGDRELTVKVNQISQEVLRSVVEPLVEKITDVRTVEIKS